MHKRRNVFTTLIELAKQNVATNNKEKLKFGKLRIQIIIQLEIHQNCPRP